MNKGLESMVKVYLKVFIHPTDELGNQFNGSGIHVYVKV